MQEKLAELEKGQDQAAAVGSVTEEAKDAPMDESEETSVPAAVTETTPEPEPTKDVEEKPATPAETKEEEPKGELIILRNLYLNISLVVEASTDEPMEAETVAPEVPAEAASTEETSATAAEAQ